MNQKPKNKMRHCFNCGAELGVYDQYPRDFDTCGKRECEREARDQRSMQDDDARHRAEEDQYGRYR